MKFIDISNSNISTTTTFNVVVQIILYAIGVVINIKMIIYCWKTRENNKSWQLHILHSVSSIIIFAVDIPFYLLTICIPYLSRFTGVWICYLFLFLNQFFGFIILVNSLMVAITKYTFIVHWDKALANGQKKIQWTVFAVLVLISFSIAILKTGMKQYNNGSIVQTCFGAEHETSRDETAWKGNLSFWCSSENLALTQKWGYIQIVSLQIICVITLVAFMVSCRGLSIYLTHGLLVTGRKPYSITKFSKR